MGNTNHFSKNHKILFLGFSNSIYHTAKLFLKKNIEVNIYSQTEESTPKRTELEKLGVLFHPNSQNLHLPITTFDAIIKGPLPQIHSSFIQAAKDNDIPIYSEFEALQDFLPRTIVVTSDDRYTLMGELLEGILKTSQPQTFLSKASSEPISYFLNDSPYIQNLIIEIPTINMDVLKHTNISILALLNDKQENNSVNPFSHFNKKTNQQNTDFLIYNIENTYSRDVALRTTSNSIPFSTSSYHQNGICIRDNSIYYDGKDFINISDVKLLNKHSIQEILIAIVVAKICYIPQCNILEFLSLDSH